MWALSGLIPWKDARWPRAVTWLILEYDVECVDNARNESQYCEGNVDQQINATSFLGENAQWWQDDGQDDLANIGTSERHDWASGWGLDGWLTICKGGQMTKIWVNGSYLVGKVTGKHQNCISSESLYKLGNQTRHRLLTDFERNAFRTEFTTRVGMNKLTWRLWQRSTLLKKWRRWWCEEWIAFWVEAATAAVKVTWRGLFLFVWRCDSNSYHENDDNNNNIALLMKFIISTRTLRVPFQWTRTPSSNSRALCSQIYQSCVCSPVVRATSKWRWITVPPSRVE